jgi:trimethylamine:corrinoid methyltransferase-like protein
MSRDIIDANDQTLAVSLIRKVNAGGHHLARNTRWNGSARRSSIHQTWSTDMKLQSKDTVQRAQETTQKIPRDDKPELLSADTEKILDDLRERS